MNELTFDLYARGGWHPKVDVYSCREGWLVKLELAGVAEQDIQVVVQSDSLIVEGRRRDWAVPETENAISMEISYDWFRRTIRLPGLVAKKPRIDYRDGMLMIYLCNN